MKFWVITEYDHEEDLTVTWPQAFVLQESAVEAIHRDINEAFEGSLDDAVLNIPAWEEDENGNGVGVSANCTYYVTQVTLGG